MLKRLGLAAIVAVATISAASAADVVRPARYQPVYVAPAFSWTGFYVGATVGANAAKDDWGFANPGFPAFISGNVSGPARLTFGALAGYNWQVGNWVFGPELNFGTGGKTSFAVASGSTAQGDTNIAYQGSLRGRIGYAAGHWMPYAIGGIVSAKINHHDGPLGGTLVGYSSYKTGWTVGAGVEYAFAGNWSARVEYDFASYGNSDHSLSPTYPVVASHRTTTNAVNLAIIARF